MTAGAGPSRKSSPSPGPPPPPTRRATRTRQETTRAAGGRECMRLEAGLHLRRVVLLLRAAGSARQRPRQGGVARPSQQRGVSIASGRHDLFPPVPAGAPCRVPPLASSAPAGAAGGQEEAHPLLHFCAEGARPPSSDCGAARAAVPEAAAAADPARRLVPLVALLELGEARRLGRVVVAVHLPHALASSARRRPRQPRARVVHAVRPRELGEGRDLGCGDEEGAAGQRRRLHTAPLQGPVPTVKFW